MAYESSDSGTTSETGSVVTQSLDMLEDRITKTLELSEKMQQNKKRMVESLLEPTHLVPSKTFEEDVGGAKRSSIKPQGPAKTNGYDIPIGQSDRQHDHHAEVPAPPAGRFEFAGITEEQKQELKMMSKKEEPKRRPSQPQPRQSVVASLMAKDTLNKIEEVEKYVPEKYVPENYAPYEDEDEEEDEPEVDASYPGFELIYGYPPPAPAKKAVEEPPPEPAPKGKVYPGSELIGGAPSKKPYAPQPKAQPRISNSLPYERNGYDSFVADSLEVNEPALKEENNLQDSIEPAPVEESQTPGSSRENQTNSSNHEESDEAEIENKSTARNIPEATDDQSYSAIVAAKQAELRRVAAEKEMRIELERNAKLEENLREAEMRKIEAEIAAEKKHKDEEEARNAKMAEGAAIAARREEMRKIAEEDAKQKDDCACDAENVAKTMIANTEDDQMHAQPKKDEKIENEEPGSSAHPTPPAAAAPIQMNDHRTQPPTQARQAPPYFLSNPHSSVPPKKDMENYYQYDPRYYPRQYGMNPLAYTAPPPNMVPYASAAPPVPLYATAPFMPPPPHLSAAQLPLIKAASERAASRSSSSQHSASAQRTASETLNGGLFDPSTIVPPMTGYSRAPPRNANSRYHGPIRPVSNNLPKALGREEEVEGYMDKKRKQERQREYAEQLRRNRHPSKQKPSQKEEEDDLGAAPSPAPHQEEAPPAQFQERESKRLTAMNYARTVPKPMRSRRDLRPESSTSSQTAYSHLRNARQQPVR